jgi:hypothetical protein
MHFYQDMVPETDSLTQILSLLILGGKEVEEHCHAKTFSTPAMQELGQKPHPDFHIEHSDFYLLYLLIMLFLTKGTRQHF